MANAIVVVGYDDFKKGLKTYTEGISDKKAIQKVLASGASIVVSSSRKIVKKSTKAHYYTKKDGTRVKILPGNLSKSIGLFKVRRKSYDVEVGPRIVRKLDALTTLGATAKKSSGFYASALYKSASNFRNQVTEAAYNLSAAKALERMDKSFNRLHEALKKKGNI